MNTRPRPHPFPQDEAPTEDSRRAVSYADDADRVADYPPPPRPSPSTVAWWGLTRSLAVKAITIVCALGLAAFVAWQLVPTPAPVRIPEGFLSSTPPHPDAPAGTPTAATEAEPPATAFVHVAGAVHDPGLVELPEGARVAEALERAGGPVDGADVGAVNLATLRSNESRVVTECRDQWCPEH